MATSCSLHGKVNVNGKEEPSLLYYELYKIAGKNRDIALNKLYSIAVSPKFLSDYKDTLVMNKQGQPTLESFIKTKAVQNLMEKLNLEKDISSILARRYDLVDSKGNPNVYNGYMIIDKIRNLDSLKDDEYELVPIYRKHLGGYIIQPMHKSIISKEEYDRLSKLKESADLAEAVFQMMKDSPMFKNAFTNIINDVVKVENIEKILPTLISIVSNINKRVIDNKQNISLSQHAKYFLSQKGMYYTQDLQQCINSIRNFKSSILHEKEVSDDEIMDIISDVLLSHLNNSKDNNTYETYYPVIETKVTKLIRDFKDAFANVVTDEKQKDLNEAYSKAFPRSNISQKEADSELEKRAWEVLEKENATLNEAKELLNKLLVIEEKRKAILKHRKIKDFDSLSQTDLINTLQQYQEEGRIEHGIAAFVAYGIRRLELLQEEVGRPNIDKKSMDNRIILLKDTLYSYSSVIKDVEAFTSQHKFDEEFKDLQKAVNNLASTITNMQHLYNRVVSDRVEDVFKTIFPNDVALQTVLNKNKTVDQSIREVVMTAPKDITITDRFIDSLAHSSDNFLKLTDKFFKDNREKTRRAILDVEDTINLAVIKYEKAAGNRDFTWMYLKNPDGTLNKNYYIQDRDYFKYDNTLKEFRETLKKQGIANNSSSWKMSMKSFYDAHTEKVNGKYLPKKSLYGNKQFESLTPAQREFYDTFMEIYETSISMLPNGSQRLRDSIKMMNTSWERIMRTLSTGNIKKTFIDSMKESWTSYSDDLEFGEVSTLNDFSGRPVQKVPIYFTKLKKDQDPSMLTNDIPSALLGFSAMAREYKGRADIANTAEIILEQAKLREVQNTKNSRTLVEKFGKHQNVSVKKGEDSNIYKKLLDIVNMQIYGQLQRDEGNLVGNVSKAKTAGQINKLTALSTYAVNGLSTLTNILVGETQLFIDAVAGEYFTVKDVHKAKKFFFKHVLQHAANFGKNIKTDLLSVIDRDLNIMQEYDQNVKRKSYINNRLKNILGVKTAYIGNEVGEFFMQMTPFLALAYNKKVQFNNKTVPLIECIDTYYVDKNNPSAGKRLKIKEGTIDIRTGKEVTMDDLYVIARKTRALNNTYHGIYNDEDKNIMQSYALGSMAIMFRKYLKPSLNRRFAKKELDIDLGEYREGYYRTAWKFMYELFGELKTGSVAIKELWESLDMHERANLKRAGTEVGIMTSLMLVLNLIDWDDDDDSYLKNLTEVTLRRWYREVQALTPSLGSISANLKLTTQPAAGVNWLENVTDMVSVILHPIDNFGEGAEIKKGAYAGYKRGVQKVLKITPINPIQRTLHPEGALIYYK